VYKKEEVYTGPYIDQAADLFLKLKGLTCIAQKDLHHPEIVGLADKTSGTHRMDGVFIMHGRGVRRQYNFQGPKLIDLCPTILYRMGLSVPDDMDGRVLMEAFDEDVIKTCPPTYIHANPSEHDSQEGVYSGAEAEMVMKSLRDLGYLE
jgi:hypothetical protein